MHKSMFWKRHYHFRQTTKACEFKEIKEILNVEATIMKIQQC